MAVSIPDLIATRHDATHCRFAAARIDDRGGEGHKNTVRRLRVARSLTTKLLGLSANMANVNAGD